MRFRYLAMVSIVLLFSCNKSVEKKSDSSSQFAETLNQKDKEIAKLKLELEKQKKEAVSYKDILKDHKTIEEEAQKYAIDLVEKQLIAPATARFHKPKTLEHELNQHFIHVIVDAQNTYGALIRASYCVILRVDPNSENYAYGNFAVSKCLNPPEKYEIEDLKIRNSWDTKLRIDTAQNMQNELKKASPTTTIRTEAEGDTLKMIYPQHEKQLLIDIAEEIRKSIELSYLKKVGFNKISIQNEKGEEESINLKTLSNKE